MRTRAKAPAPRVSRCDMPSVGDPPARSLGRTPAPQALGAPEASSRSITTSSITSTGAQRRPPLPWPTSWAARRKARSKSRVFGDGLRFGRARRARSEAIAHGLRSAATAIAVGLFRHFGRPESGGIGPIPSAWGERRPAWAPWGRDAGHGAIVWPLDRRQVPGGCPRTLQRLAPGTTRSSSDRLPPGGARTDRWTAASAVSR